MKYNKIELQTLFIIFSIFFTPSLKAYFTQQKVNQSQSGSVTTAIARAENLIKIRKFESAEKELKSALKTHLNSAELWEKLGDVYNYMDMYSFAIASYSEALKIQNNRCLSYLGIGHALEKQQFYLEALQSFHRALTLDPYNARAYHGIFVQHLKLANAIEAEKNLAELKKLDPDWQLQKEELALDSLKQVLGKPNMTPNKARRMILGAK